MGGKMDYEDMVDMDFLLGFMLKNTIRNEDDQNILGGIFSEVKETGWNDDLRDRLRLHIESLVPVGDYCYSYQSREEGDESLYPKIALCPFWDRSDEQEKQEAGFCHLLQHGDCEFNDSKIYVNCRTRESRTANEIGISLSLLWDQCKECNVNP